MKRESSDRNEDFLLRTLSNGTASETGVLLFRLWSRILARRREPMAPGLQNTFQNLTDTGNGAVGKADIPLAVPNPIQSTQYVHTCMLKMLILAGS